LAIVVAEIVFLDGKLVPAKDAAVVAFDNAFLYGAGLFETMRVYGGRPFALSEHLERLGRSALELKMPETLPTHKLRDAVLQTIKANRITTGYTRLTVTGGSGDIRDREGQGSVFVYAKGGSPYPAELYARGASLAVAKERRSRDVFLAGHKTTSYFSNLLAQREAQRQGADEALFLTPDGYIAEGSRTNFFAVLDGVLLTPPLAVNVLPGITRAKVLGLAEGLGISACEKLIRLESLVGASEAFITSSLMEILPVRNVGGADFPNCPGPAASRLRTAYRNLVSSSLGV